VVTCPLVPGVPHLLSGSCASPRTCGVGFLQTSPRADTLALLLAVGSAHTWHGDFHPVSSVPCLAHTTKLTCRGRLQHLHTARNQYGGPGQVQRLVRRRHSCHNDKPCKIKLNGTANAGVMTVGYDEVGTLG
jgi:hypothetical protein